MVFQDVLRGCRPYTTKKRSEVKKIESKSEEESMKHSANLSLGIVDVFGIKAGASFEKGGNSESGNEQKRSDEDINWDGLGGI